MCIITSMLCVSCQKHAVTDYDVIPQPLSINMTDGSEPFTLSSNTTISYTAGDSALAKNAELLAGYLKEQTGLSLQITDSNPSNNSIKITTGLEVSNPEAYKLTITPELITIDGASAAGAFYGAQTLRKAIGVTDASKIELAATEIYDEPRFGYRGAHLDVARYFFPIDSVKSFIDMIALHNINRFHWHLTDDQGWRIEIKSHPELIEKGSMRRNTVIGHNSGEYDSIPVGGFYTQDELRDMVKYAADRHITIIPEVDLPGHMVAALAAYPELGCTGGPYEVWNRWGISKEVLCAGNPDTYTFLKDVLDEVTDIFPSEYIHIGGDECPKERWKECPKCQAKIKELGIKADPKHTAEQKLQSYVMTEMEQYLNSKGRRVIGWDEILEGGLGPDATVHSWRGINGGE
ncbi:MAG: beta-N-acetylhexosaminidase, partial [Muribaculaceae bacterium]|nr:beta-N-acetylhexosaminidase [Muribaculaceae bacterium]